ncbi:MAG: hypothetical protein WCV56_05590 [Candidatus Omnitrophota bacterium]
MAVLNILKILCLSILLLAVEVGRYAYSSDFPKIHGFLEEAFAPRVGKDDTRHRQFNMAEARAQLKTNHYFIGNNILADWQTFVKARCDFVLDIYEGGKVITDLRELNVSFTPLDIADIKVGRQVLTWGTGDYLFLNDLFPKDYVSFFIGRDDEYLKIPNDAFRLMLYPEWFNVDLVWIPFFEPDTVPSGYRVSYFDTFQGKIAGVTAERDVLMPAKKLSNFVYAARIYRNFQAYEAAFYYYRGFDPSPKSYYDEQAHQLYHERLDSYGASLRGPVFWGIGNIEAAYYYSPDDSVGDIRTIQNSRMKYLAGYEKDLSNDFKMAFQYYLEQTLDYRQYERALLPMDYKWKEYRHTITNRMTKFFADQTVKISIFTFFSPSDLDVYTRPSISWSPQDGWTLTVGANLPWGKDSLTEFGSVQKNKNVYARLRYSF